MTLSLKQFRESRKITDSGYVYHGGFHIEEGFDVDEDVYIICLETFTDFDKAEEQLYQMYCDEDRLSEGY